MSGLCISSTFQVEPSIKTVAWTRSKFTRTQAGWCLVTRVLSPTQKPTTAAKIASMLKWGCTVKHQRILQRAAHSVAVDAQETV